ncbi:tripartite motif-containing protein 67-like [Oratosquilla oratoria]|uniref:tripartite motif-containing protein 67-like n=1 Tax=Oratosquilla oratoria TaxID=337810 RepID=UPI003F764838
MEEELRCPACSCLFVEPLLLPCLHAVCLQCALGLQRPAQLLLTDPNAGHPVGHTVHDPEPPDGGDSDKGSVYSETDSGVVVASRPNSYLSSPEVVAGGSSSSSGGSQGGGGGSTSTSTSSSTSSGNSDASDSSNCSSNTVVVGGQGVRCPSCRKVAVLGPAGLSALPRYTAMARIIARYKGAADSATTSSAGTSSTSSSGGTASAAGVAPAAGGAVGQGTPPPCQLCEGPPRPATTECQQCHVLYCGPCLASCHPARGPLATHTLGPVAPLENPSGGGGSTSSSSISLPGEVCALHGERPTLYCLVCSWSGCRDCGPLHSQHDLQPLDNIARTHKVRYEYTCVCVCVCVRARVCVI